ncbi:hypothetical protein POM88_017562 [Heracleum sosnowskyi]|uniref:Uncharacterized protein n=1 Tax=Heracleum sosnowskyi TaxID=360622 RepID=A0AAD8IQQ3_9APIA|nr:hypothetical protein POM88_017562 [Heracleum sosnowskyi]
MNHHQELPVLEHKPATNSLKVAQHPRLKLDRGGRVFRIGSDISHSGSDISPVWTSPLLASLLYPLNIVTQRGMLYFYCKQILSGENEEEVELEYVEQLHILLQSDSRLDEFVPREIVTYLMDFLVDENIFQYLELEDIDTQTHIISILCHAVRSWEIGEEMRNNIIENLMRLIESKSMYVQAELLFGLAHLSKFDEYRHHLLKLGVLEKLVEIARRGNNVILPDCALLFSVICFSERNLPADKGDAAIQIAIYLIKHRGCNHEVTAQAFSALAYLSEGKYVGIEGASCERLMQHISDAEDSVAVSALEVVGNIVRWGKVRQVTIMIKNGILKHLQRLLSHKFIMVRKEACWIISNITVGRKTYLKDLYEVNLPYSLCNLLEADDLDLRMEAVWAIFNSIIYDNHDEQINYPNRSRTCPYILGQTRKIAPEPSVRVMASRWSDYVPYVKKIKSLS